MEGVGNFKRKLLAEQVQEQILQLILSGPLEVGTKLPNEFELAKLFGVGRSTVREAVKQLASRGILEVRRGSGTYVSNTAPVDMDPLGLGLVEDKAALILDLVDVRILLEPGIAEMAAMNATDLDIEKLRGLCGLLERKIREGTDFREEDIAFHACVAECSKNKVAEHLIPLIDAEVVMFVDVAPGKPAEETAMTYRAMADAIAGRDPVGARSAMMMHMVFYRKMIKGMMEQGQGKHEA